MAAGGSGRGWGKKGKRAGNSTPSAAKQRRQKSVWNGGLDLPV